MKERYRTIAREASDEVIIQKSRFIGHACPCATEEDALAFLRRMREEYRDATHNCYAYVIGANQGIMRYSDDGEPTGTAGLPMMEVLKKREIVNCAVVVTRYFGGILLGAGGLVRAYTQGCAIALEAAGPVIMERTRGLYCEVPYPVWDSLRHALETETARMDQIEYSDRISFRLLMKEEDAEAMLERLNNVTGRKLEVVLSEESYEPWEIK